MTDKATGLAMVALELAGIDANFDIMLDTVMKRMRLRMGVPEAAGPGVVDQIVEEEFRAARERLASFRTEYRELHARLLLKYVASDSLPALVRSLEDETLQSYFRAMREMSGEAAAGLETLGRKMKEAVPF